MDPGSWIMLASAAVGAMSAMDSADARADSARAQANIANTQATIAEQTADNARQVGNANEERQRRQSALVLGQKRAGLLSAGIGADGSAADVYSQLAGSELLKALDARYDGNMNAWRAENQVGIYNQQAAASLASADAAETAGMYGAATSLLSGAGKIYDNYSKADTIAAPTTKITDYRRNTADDISKSQASFA